MNAEQFVTYLQDESHLYSLNYQEFKALSVKYPYCQNLHFLIVKKSQLENIAEKEHRKNVELAAAYLTDRRLLFQKLKQLREQPPQITILSQAMPNESLLELATLSEIEQKRQEQILEMWEGEAISDTLPPLSSSLAALSLSDDLVAPAFNLPTISATDNFVDDMLENTENIDNQSTTNQNNEMNDIISLTDSPVIDEELDAILAILSSPDAAIQAALEAKAAEKINQEPPISISSTPPEVYLEMVAAFFEENEAHNPETEPLTVEAPSASVAAVATKYDEDFIPEPPKPLPPKPEFSRLEWSDFTEDYLAKEYQLAAEQLAAHEAANIKFFDDEFGAKLEAVQLNEIATLPNEENKEEVAWELKQEAPPSVPPPQTPKKRISFNTWLTQFAPSTAPPPTPQAPPQNTPPQATKNGYADEDTNILDIDSQDLDPDMRRISLQQLDRLFENPEPLGDLPLMKATTKKVTEAPTKKVKKSKKENTMHILAERSITPDNDLISETLAALLAKQEKNEEAIAMYEKLSLKFPEKSVFFAAKIAELKLRS